MLATVEEKGRVAGGLVAGVVEGSHRSGGEERVRGSAGELENAVDGDGQRRSGIVKGWRRPPGGSMEACGVGKCHKVRM